MKKIVTVCGQGLGSSLVVEMNVKTALQKLNKEHDFHVSHENLNTFDPNNCDIVICGEDIAPSIQTNNKIIKIILTNIMDVNELISKIKGVI